MERSRAEQRLAVLVGSSEVSQLWPVPEEGNLETQSMWTQFLPAAAKVLWSCCWCRNRWKCSVS